MTTQELSAKDDALNEMTRTGQILEALEQYYAEDCTFQEGNGEPRMGRAAQHEHLSTFFETLQSLNGATLRGRGVGSDVTLSEWTFDMVGPNGEAIVWNEVLARRWRDGKVVSERYYTAA